ncbi:MAG: ankyrin repeat domain-containing protein [Akkermansia sp.]|nr:ankyrin repeat domain-containing protein [Akkermansia sp.]
MNLRPFVCSAFALLALGATTSGEEASSFVLPASEQINKAGELMRTPLMQAVRRGNADEVRALLAAGADPNIPEWHNNTPLMHACQHGYTDIVRMLLAAGADVNARDDEGWTALMGVCVSRNNPTTEIAEMLLAAGADITPADTQYGHTALVYAAKSSKAEHVAMLLKAGADATAHTGLKFCEATVLTSAVQCKATPEVLRLLIAAGADVNKGVRDRAYIDTPLGEAIWTRDTDSVRTLLEAGANANPPGDSYLSLATARGDARVLQMLLAAGADVNTPNQEGHYALGSAAAQGKADHVRILLEAGADVNAVDGNGDTALLNAAWATNPESLQILLAAGAQVNLTNKKGETALMWAAFVGNAPHVAALLAAGADKTLRNADGLTAAEIITHITISRHSPAMEYPLGQEMAYTAIYGHLNGTPSAELTPLMQAVLMRNPEDVSALLADGADVNAASALGRTALMMAADTHQPEKVELLLSAGADVHARDLQGNTALILAQLEQRGFLNCYSWERVPHGENAMTRCTQLLLAAGADARACNRAGQNALMTASYRRSFTPDAEAAFRLLINAGADINSRDNEGRTPLMYALMQQDHGWMVPVLTSLGADINARDNEGRTPLMYAVQGYMADVAWQRLMAAKPDIHARDNSGKQAIDYTLPTSNNRKRLLELQAQ